eukprot:scaffold18430_cov111-Isochrysis_galbana.AAC.1
MRTSRPSPETTPTVKEWSNPNGLPIARAVEPTRRSAEEPRASGKSFVPLELIFSTATSLSGLYPTSVAANSLVSPFGPMTPTLA